MTEFRDGLFNRNGRAALRIVLPLPPTDNHIYQTIRISKKKGGGANWGTTSGRSLTPTARSYKLATATDIAHLAVTNSVQFKKNVPYLLRLKIFFSAVENKSWSKNNAKTRYKKVDTTNRNKLLIDSITQAIGVDDSHIFPVIKLKDSCQDDPRVEVEICELAPEELPELYQAIDSAVEEFLWD